jgi:uncharacterized protein
MRDSELCIQCEADSSSAASANTSSFIFPDTSVWVALSCRRHKFNAICRAWLESLASNVRICFCRFTQVGLLRLLTTKGVTGEDQPLTQVEAWCTLDKWIEDPRITFLDEPSTFDATFRYYAQLPLPAPKAWSDQYLIAFAQCAGGCNWSL